MFSLMYCGLMPSEERHCFNTFKMIFFISSSLFWNSLFKIGMIILV